MAQSTSNTDWQTGMSRISQRAGYLLQSGQWSDCTFVVGSGNNQKTLQAHRLILAMSSPVFEAMFFGGMAEKGDKPVEILDVQPQAFKALLQYIYSDEINLKSFDQVCEICYAAKKYMIPSLVEQCTQFIWSDLHPGNVCRAFEFARLFEEPLLLEKCLQIICTKTEDVLKDSSFEEVEIGTLRTILKQDSLTASALTPERRRHMADTFVNRGSAFKCQHASGFFPTKYNSTHPTYGWVELCLVSRPPSLKPWLVQMPT
ncbi:BTB/POZ domain-containing protein 6-B-like isoform X2 [Macrobrachium rosenbergii]|uniref:BTB/POZ domain-containing protein 6-B-like isoform X2 n=1 Tax=Macrobrachium rosenbergii TaxID=79674 RepID=UPI0034D74A33